MSRLNGALGDVFLCIYLFSLVFISADALAEVKFEQAQANSDKLGRPNAIVAHAHLSDPDLDAKLAALCAAGKNVRGIRQLINWHERADLRFTDAEYLRDPKWLAGFALLEKCVLCVFSACSRVCFDVFWCRYKLSFDLQVYAAHQAADCVALARKYPQTLLILNHTGMPIDRDDKSIALWREGISAMAKEKNIVAKISGLGMVCSCCVFACSESCLRRSTIIGQWIHCVPSFLTCSRSSATIAACLRAISLSTRFAFFSFSSISVSLGFAGGQELQRDLHQLQAAVPRSGHQR